LGSTTAGFAGVAGVTAALFAASACSDNLIFASKINCFFKEKFLRN
jgi:hypothetical protein